MKRRTKVIVGIVVIASIIFATIAIGIASQPFSLLQLYQIAISGEKFGRSELSIAENTLKGEPASTMITIDGVEHEFPLPNGATSFGEWYMICREELQPYLDRLPSLGYSFVDQMGTLFIYQNDDLDIRLHIGAGQYSRAFFIFSLTIGGTK